MKHVRRAVLIVLILSTAIVGLVTHALAGSRFLRVYFLDIGQGDSIYIRTPSGHDMLVDGGPSAATLQKLAEVMPWNDRTIDIVMESHPDADHIGGLPEIVGRYNVGMFIESGIESKNSIDDELHRRLRKKNIPIILARRGLRINFGDGAVFDILFPDKDVSHMPDTNTASLVGQMCYGDTTVMLNGDSPKEVENHLVLLDGARLRSDILKAAHHGSHSASGEEYVKIVNPTYAVISAGKNNRYKHPHPEVLEIFKKLGIQVARTDEEGTVSFVSDGKNVTRK